MNNLAAELRATVKLMLHPTSRMAQDLHRDTEVLDRD